MNRIVSKQQAIKMLEEMPDDGVVLITFDFEDEISDCGKCINKNRGKKYIDTAKTRVISGNQYTAQLNLYSVLQSDIRAIEPRGIMRTILLNGIKDNFGKHAESICSN